MSDGKAGRPQVGKQYGIKFAAEEADYIERVRTAQRLKTFSAAARHIIQYAMRHNIFVESEPTP